MSVSVYRHMVGAFHVSSAFTVAARVRLLRFSAKPQILKNSALESSRKPQ